MNLLSLPGAEHEILMSAELTGVAREASERLWRSGYLALRDVSCVASQGVVSLHGRLPSYYLKQVAQEIAAGVEGADHVINCIEVLATAEHRREGPSCPDQVGLNRNTTASLVARMDLAKQTTLNGVCNDVGLEPQAE